MSEPWVVDTNVGVVANDRLDDRPDPPHLPSSVSSCASFLREVTRSGRVAIDDAWEIIREYQARMRSSGQPGLGDAFLKWVLVNQANPARCSRVDITGIRPTATENTAQTDLCNRSCADCDLLRKHGSCAVPALTRVLRR